jgi:hypothetical protein
MRKAVAIVVALGLVAAACGAEEPSLSAYADQVEAMVTTMNARLDAVDDEVAGTTDPELIRWYASERAAARRSFVDDLTALEPPEGLAELHAAAVEIMTDLATAEAALADRVDEMDTIDGIDAVWATPEGTAARAADAEAITLCRAAEDELDLTEERAAIEGVPWVPTEMRAPVKVAFGCKASNR